MIAKMGREGTLHNSRNTVVCLAPGARHDEHVTGAQDEWGRGDVAGGCAQEEYCAVAESGGQACFSLSFSNLFQKELVSD
jgi:hypothetical protein